MKHLSLLAVLCFSLLQAACIHVFHTVEARQIRPVDGLRVEAAVRAHLLDGAAVVFANGVLVAGDSLRGEGALWTADRTRSSPVTAVALADVAGMESYRREVDAGQTTAVSLIASIVVPVGVIALACIADPKCFGSCPTFYVEDSPGEFTLLAEGFSFSIAPLLEMRDVDRLSVAPGGAVQLELRNEAFETHYVNHIELLEARHAAGSRVVPDSRGRPVAIGGLLEPRRATDRSGRDVRATLSAADASTYSTAPAVLEAADENDLFDTIELVFPAVAGDSVAIAFRMRNSLLTTVLLYELMLAEPGARALDWQEELQGLAPAMDLVRWYAERMGMHVEVWRDGAYRPAGRIGDTGPIAWKEVALVVPAPQEDSLRVRLRFVADQWRIDQVRVGAPERPEVSVITLAEIRDAAGEVRTDLLHRLREADEKYVEVLPGQRYTIRFDADSPDTAAERTLLLASQGFYQEWIRQGWLLEPRSGRTFEPSDATMAEALRRYRSSRAELEERFFATRIPVR